MKLTDDQRFLVAKQVEKITAEHHQKIARMTKDLNAERKRLEDILQFGYHPQTI